jgi:hypothetical protein
MIMTNALASQLMETLACVALSATGGVDPDNINPKQMEYAENYAKETFCDLLGAWEELTGEKWKIEEERN